MEDRQGTQLTMASRAALESMKFPSIRARYLAWIGTAEDVPWEYAEFVRRRYGLEKAEEMLAEAVTLTFMDRLEALRALYEARLYMHGRKFAEPSDVSRIQYFVSLSEEAPVEAMGLARLKMGTKDLTFGARLSAAIFAVSLLASVLSPAIALAGIFIAVSTMLLHFYVYWLDTGESILNPKFLVVGVVAMIGLALTALATLLPL